MTTLRAFFLHITISATIVGVALSVVFFVWYPHPYFEILGAGNVVRILVGVDLILGPILTLILYRPGKRYVLFDLGFIAVVQLAALAYGMVTIHSERPLYTVFAVDRFSVLGQHDVDAAEVPAEIKSTRPNVGPILAVAKLPEDRQAREDLMFQLLNGAKDIEFRPELWHMFDSQLKDVVDRARPIDDLAAAGQDIAARVARMPSKLERPAKQLGFVPVVNKAMQSLSLIIDLSTGQPIDVVAVDPWGVPPAASAFKDGNGGLGLNQMVQNPMGSLYGGGYYLAVGQ
jgi:hypothetical protein